MVFDLGDAHGNRILMSTGKDLLHSLLVETH